VRPPPAAARRAAPPEHLAWGGHDEPHDTIGATPVTIRERFGELIRFGMVGGLSTLIYLGVYSGLVWAGVGFALAALVAFAASTTSGFFLHHRYTFRTDSPTAGGMARWLSLQGTVIGIDIALLAMLVHAVGLDRILAQVVLLPLIPLLTFFASRRLVFQPDNLYR
jgi:putative flippase GtrA